MNNLTTLIRPTQSIDVISFYSPRCLGQDTAKGSFDLPSQAATWLPHTVNTSHSLFITEGQIWEAVNCNFLQSLV